MERAERKPALSASRHYCVCACRETYILIPAYCFIDVSRRELVELLIVTEDDDGDIHLTEHRQLVGFLEQTALSLEECSAKSVVSVEN